MNAEQMIALELVLRLAEQGSLPRNEGDPVQNKALEVIENYLNEQQARGYDDIANTN
jgi:hypothetical protein